MNASVPSDAETAAEEGGDPIYSYKPNLMGSPFVFRLGPTGLAWEYGRRSGSIGYDQVQRVRISFRPATLQAQRYLAEIWAPQGPKLQIASTSFRGLVEQTRQDAEYTAFVRELHRRLAAAGSAARFEAGMHPMLYWPGAAVFTAIGLAVGGFLVHTLLNGDWTGAAVVVGVIVLLLWQIGTMFYRNRPLTYRPEAPPGVVLPRG